jgi:glycosyltransferase involved in cell wall biosynthesis
MARELHIGGSERQMTETARALDRSVFEPHVGCFRPAGIRGDELRATGVPVVQFPVMSYRSPRVIGEARRLAQYIRENGIRIVHTWDAPLTAYAIPVTRMMTKAVALSSQRAHRELIPFMLRRFTRLSDRIADGVVVNCEFLRRHLIEDEHVRPRKIHICYNGIDPNRFRRSAAPPHPLTIGTVCALRPEKDLTTLIGAFARLLKLYPELRLVIVGSGPELASLLQYAREADAVSAIHFEPTTTEVPEWFSSIDIFVLPSRSEAFSNSLMEAMACGCCAVASNVGGNPELVKPGETGLLFKPRDPDDLASTLRTLIESPDLRRDLAARGQAFLANFSIETAARRMGEIYTSLVP